MSGNGGLKCDMCLDLLPAEDVCDDLLGLDRQSCADCYVNELLREVRRDVPQHLQRRVFFRLEGLGLALTPPTQHTVKGLDPCP